MAINVQYPYADSSSADTHRYLLPTVKRVVTSRQWPEKRTFDLGCGNGVGAAQVLNLVSNLKAESIPQSVGS